MEEQWWPISMQSLAVSLSWSLTFAGVWKPYLHMVDLLAGCLSLPCPAALVRSSKTRSDILRESSLSLAPADARCTGVQYRYRRPCVVLVHTSLHPSLLTRHFLITTTRHRLALTIVTQFSVSAPFNNDNGCSNEMFFFLRNLTNGGKFLARLFVGW